MSLARSTALLCNTAGIWDDLRLDVGQRGDDNVLLLISAAWDEVQYKKPRALSISLGLVRQRFLLALFWK